MILALELPETHWQRSRRHQCRWVRALATESNESSFTHIAFPDAPVLCRSGSSPYFLQTRLAILLFPPLFPTYINALCCHSSLFFFFFTVHFWNQSHIGPGIKRPASNFSFAIYLWMCPIIYSFLVIIILQNLFKVKYTWCTILC